MQAVNRDTLLYIIMFMKKIVKQSKTNLMDATALTRMFAPNIFRKRKGNEDAIQAAEINNYFVMHSKNMEVMMENFEDIFKKRLSQLPVFNSDSDEES